jgi:hypothetical protein
MAPRFIGTAPNRAKSRVRAARILAVSHSVDEADARVDHFIVYGAYGEIMHRFQVFELTLWQMLARGIKPGMTADQAMDKVEKWDATTFGSVVRGLKSQTHWPDGMTNELQLAVEARNYLAHFLREDLVVAASEETTDQAMEQLAKILDRLDRLEQDLEDHLHSLGGASIEDLDDEVKAEIDKLRPTVWLSEE